MAVYSSFIQSYVGTESAKHFRALVYGAAGSGKTTFAGTFPKPLFIDTDRGMRSLGNAADVKMIRLSGDGGAFQTCYTLLNDARLKRDAFAPGGPLADRQTIVIDGISSLADEYLLREIMRENKRDPLTEKAQFDDYGRLKMELIQLGNIIKDVSDHYNVVVTALVDEEKDELTGALEGKPLMTGKYRDLIGGVFDEEYYIEAVDAGGTPKYILHASKFKWYEAKTRLMKVTKLENPTYAMVKANLKVGPGAGA